MKDSYFFLIAILILLSCSKKDQEPGPMDCEHEEFHIEFLANKACFKADFFRYTVNSGNWRSIHASKSGAFKETLTISFNDEFKVKDTIFLETDFDEIENLGVISYSYSEGALVGQFKITTGAGTKSDFLIIDDINEDTTMIAGRFQCRFQERLVNSFVDAPDTLSIQNGSFKLIAE